MINLKALLFILVAFNFEIGAQTNCAPVINGTAALWKGEWNANDEMSINHGRLANGVTFVPGKVGMAFKFDSIGPNINQYVSVLTNYTTSHPVYGAYNQPILGNFTVSFWAKTSRLKEKNCAIRGPAGHVMPPDNNENNAGIGIHFGTDGVKLTAHSADYLVNLFEWNSPAPLTDWTHVGIVYENNLPKIYINGFLVAESLQNDGSNHIYFPGPGAAIGQPLFAIGGGQNNQFVSNTNIGNFIGLLDEIQIIDHPLTQPSIQEIVNLNAQGQCLPVTISGTVYHDVNENCVYNQNTDFPVSNRLIEASGSFYVFTDNDGKYEISLPDGNYILKQTTISNDIFEAVDCNQSDIEYNINVTGGALITNKNFFNVLSNGSQCNAGVDIHPIYPSPLDAPCPDIEYTICATFTNMGPAITQGNFSLTLDNNLTIISILSSSDCCSSYNQVGQTITCSGTSTFPANRTCSICVRVKPCHTCLGLPMTTTASIIGKCMGNTLPTINAVPLVETVTCAIDPNDKLLVTPKGCGPFEYISGEEELTYRIRFQNTGNAPAHNIVLLDEIDSDLDLSSLRIIASSHPITKTEINPANLLQISFIGIELPDSVNNEARSHGFVILKIKPKSGLADGTIITNKTEIYFDLNAPVITNNTTNTIRNIVQPVDLNPFEDVCIDANAFPLTGGTPTGGTYSGEGVFNGVFYPDLAGTGTHAITYEYASEIPEYTYILNQSDIYNPVSGSGTQVFLADDQISAAQPIGFDFNFYGTNYSHFYISSNGFITFNAGSSDGCCSGLFIPHYTTNPSNLIAFAWDDLYPPGNGSIDYFTTGVSPSRKLIVNFTNIPACCNSVPKVSSQIILYEGTNIIEIHSSSVDLPLGTMGVVNNVGTFATAVPERNANTFSISNDFVQFIPDIPILLCSNSAKSSITVNTLPCAWFENNTGSGCEGDWTYDIPSEEFTGTSTNCYYANPFIQDDLSFAARDLCGNGSITVEVKSISGNLAWAGITMRETNTDDSKKIQLMTNLSLLSRREARYTTGGTSYFQQFPSRNRYWLRLVRTGNQFAGYVSPDGSNWYPVMAANINMNTCLKVGMVVTNYNPISTSTAVFGNVVVTDGGNNRPVATDDVSLEQEKGGGIEATVKPNPTTGHVNIQFSSNTEQELSLKVMDILGRTVNKGIIDVGRSSFDVWIDDLAGIYIIELADKQGNSFQRKVIKIE